MNTEVLEDGSMAPRKKGDLYWKKYKLLEQAEEHRASKGKVKKADVFVSDILKKYHEGKDSGTSELDGNEFRRTPPTSTGRDVLCDAVIRGMRARDRFKESGTGEDILPALDKMITIFFHACGFDEATGKPIDKEEKKAARASYIEAEKAYADALISKGIERPERPHSTLDLQTSRISPNEFSTFSEHIPNNYLGQLNNGSLIATGYYEKEDAGGGLAGVSITAEHGGWKELVWASLPSEKLKEDFLIEFFRFIFDEAEKENKYKGIFMELHMLPETHDVTDILAKAGMDVHFEKNNIYEFTLDDVVKDPSLFKAAEKLSCVPLLFSWGPEKDLIEELIYNEDKAVPVAFPIPWDSYQADISEIHYNEKTKTAGLLLFTKVMEYLVMDLCYGVNAIVLAALIGSALKAAEETYEGSQKVLAPIVSESTRPLIEKMVPNAKRGEIAEAMVWF